MPRIRSIKPDFWTDEKIVELPMPERLFFIGTWNFADDFGNLPRSPQKLKMQIFPADVIDVEPLVRSLITHGLLTEYSVKGSLYLHINGFRKHQRINRPSKDGLVPRFEERDVLRLTEPSLSAGGGANALSEPQSHAEQGDETNHAGSLSEHSLSHHGGNFSDPERGEKTAEKTEALSEPQKPATQGGEAGEAGALTEHSLTEKEKEKEVNLKPKPIGNSEVSGTASRTRARETPKPHDSPPPNPSAVISKTMREHGIAKAAPSNVRIIALADAGVTPERVIEACDEAHATHPDEAISANYVCSILEAWQRNGHDMTRATGSATSTATRHSTSFDERSQDRKRTANFLTGHHRRNGSTGEVIDIDASTVKEIGNDRKPRNS
jgi:hypothetical protein